MRAAPFVTLFVCLAAVVRGQRAGGEVMVVSRAELEALPAESTQQLLVAYPFPAADLTALARFSKLRELSLFMPRGGVLADAVAKLRSLRRLTLVQAPLDQQAVAALRDLPMLESVTLSLSSLDAGGATELATLPVLEDLRLESCPTVGVATLETVTRMKALRRLAIADCQGVPKRGFLRLAGMQALRELDLYNDDGGARLSKRPLPGDADGVGVDDEVLAALASLPRLERLSLNRCFRLTANGMAALAHFPALTGLDLTCLDACVPAAIESAPTTLQSLSLSFCSVDATLLARLAVRLRALRQLDLSLADGVDANALAALSKLPALEQLNLAQIKTLTDNDLAALRGCTHLRELAIGGPNQLTVPGLRALATLPMQCIDLRSGGDTGGLGGKGTEPSGLDPDGVCKLARELWPGCRVIAADGVEHVAR